MTGTLTPAGCCNALGKGARDMGASIVLRNRVVDINQRASGEWEVVTEQGTIVCEMVVNAAGCYARQVAQMVGSDVPITNMQHTYIVTEPIQEFIEREEEMPVMRDPYPSAYYRQEQKSAADWHLRNPGTRKSAGNTVVAGRSGEQRTNCSKQILTAWRRLSSGSWNACRFGRTPALNAWFAARFRIPRDANPLLGPAEGLRNFWQCNGASVGIAAGAGCGK